MDAIMRAVEGVRPGFRLALEEAAGILGVYGKRGVHDLIVNPA
jgi:hypothetical protein